jgi:hypothetical protein
MGGAAQICRSTAARVDVTKKPSGAALNCCWVITCFSRVVPRFGLIDRSESHRLSQVSLKRDFGVVKNQGLVVSVDL